MRKKKSDESNQSLKKEARFQWQQPISKEIKISKNSIRATHLLRKELILKTKAPELERNKLKFELNLLRGKMSSTSSKKEGTYALTELSASTS